MSASEGLPRDPSTPGEWHEAAVAAAGLLRIHAAKAYGFITGGPVIDADRCEAVLEKAKKSHEIVPNDDEIDGFLAGYLAANT